MSEPGDPRKTAAWRRLVVEVVRDEPLCWLRYTGCTRWSDTADHVIPVKARPDLALDRSNLRGACHHCNHTRGRRPVEATRFEL